MTASFPLDYWRQVFEYESHQVHSVEIVDETDTLRISIKGRNEILTVTSQELNASLNEFAGNPLDVVFAFLRKSGILVIYYDTLVAFFDIQAYSEFINRTPMKEAVWKINNVLSSVQSTAKTDLGPVKFNSCILSDSIILVIDTNRCRLHSGSINFFFLTCASIMFNAISNGFPLRGAIGGGDFFKDGEMMVSPALVDAARYEKHQDWFGAVLTPNAHALVEDSMKTKTTFKGKIDIDFNWDFFKPALQFGVIPWKPSANKNIDAPLEWFYIKPQFPSFYLADQNWTAKFMPHYLPDYFEDRDNKIKNSMKLYTPE